jgi:hypothetical protein
MTEKRALEAFHAVSLCVAQKQLSRSYTLEKDARSPLNAPIEYCRGVISQDFESSKIHSRNRFISYYLYRHSSYLLRRNDNETDGEKKRSCDRLYGEDSAMKILVARKFCDNHVGVCPLLLVLAMIQRWLEV